MGEARRALGAHGRVGVEALTMVLGWPFMARTSLLLSLVLMVACSNSEPAQGRRSNPRDSGLSSSNGGMEGGATDAGTDVTETPAGQLFAFVGSSDGRIRTFAVDAAGAWTPKGEGAGGADPSFLAFDPTRRRVVAVDESAGRIKSFTFDAASGGLTEVNSKPAGGSGPTHLSFDPNGKWVIAANYTSGNMSIRPIDENGVLGDATDTKPSGANSHWAGTNPSGTHVFVPALGANHVAQYTMNTETGKLVNNGVAKLPDGAGPRHLAFHPSQKWAYTINELAITATTFAFENGKLTPLDTISALPPGQDTNGVSGAEIVVHPSGKWVYASTRGYDSIAQFSVDAATGKLTRVANTEAGGSRPRSFGIDPEGTRLFAGNQTVGRVTGFKIGANGALTPLGKTVDVPGPTFVGLARMR